MGNISVKIAVFIVLGIPQAFLTVLALYFFTQTKFILKKYIILSIICTISTYLIRLFPIALGVNTVLTLLVMILSFELVNKSQLSRVGTTIISATAICVLIAFTEVLNMLVLSAVFGQEKAIAVLNSSDQWVQAFSYTPSNLYFAAFIILANGIIKKIGKRKVEYGKAGETAGE